MVALVAVLYCAFPTRQYYWDGVLFSLNIEDARANGIGSLLLPNHLLYNPLGYFVFRLVRAVVPGVRALAVLQSLNIAFSITTAWILIRFIRELTRDNYIALTLGTIFACGATWWKYSVDADAYILPALLLLLAARYLIREPLGAGDLAVVAALHVAAMSIHQLGVFFLPAVWVSLLSERPVPVVRRAATAITYSVLTSAAVAFIYWQAYLDSNAALRYGSFLNWVTSHSEDSSFLFRPVSILTATAVSYIHLLFGGRVRLLVDFSTPWTIPVFAALVIALVALVVKLWRYRADAICLFAAPEPDRNLKRTLAVFTAWLIPYALFLLVWLPKNTFYKLLFWPAAIVITACLLKLMHSGGAPHRNRLAALAVFQLCWNFVAFIYPYSETRANVVLDFGEHIARRWAPGTRIYFQSFDSDDWTVRYAAPQTTWIGMAPSPQASIRQLEEARRTGSLWLDPTAMKFLNQGDSNAREWLATERRTGRMIDCCGRRWRLQFTCLLPR